MTVNEFYQSLFNTKVYKLSLDAGCTCPTRDGTLGTGGCTFCSASGSGDFTPENVKGGRTCSSITEQVSEAKKILSKKLKKSNTVKYIAYFQSFTNTYGNLEKLKAQWEEALSCDDVIGLAIGTRPDCLSDECIQVLGQMAEKTFLQVELGFQTCNEATAEGIHRGFTNDVYERAVERLHRANKKIHVVSHVIFGLPGDNQNDMLETVRKVISAGSDGIKITSLYVLKGSGLEADFSAGKFRCLEMEEYFSVVGEALKLLPENMIIHRLTGDPPKALIIEPKWTCDKKKVLNRVNQLLANS